MHNAQRRVTVPHLTDTASGALSSFARLLSIARHARTAANSNNATDTPADAFTPTTICALSAMPEWLASAPKAATPIAPAACRAVFSTADAVPARYGAGRWPGFAGRRTTVPQRSIDHRPDAVDPVPRRRRYGQWRYR